MWEVIQKSLVEGRRDICIVLKGMHDVEGGRAGAAVEGCD